MKRVLRMVEADLGGQPLVLRGIPKVTYEAPPVINDFEYFGVPLRDALVPVCHLNGVELEAAFRKLLLGESVSLGRMPDHFIAGDPYKFVVWASKAEFASLDFCPEEGRLLCLGETVLGYADGAIVGSEDAHPFTPNFDSITQWNHSATRDLRFCAVLKRARAQNNKEAEIALAAIRYYYPGPWRMLAPWMELLNRIQIPDEVVQIIGNSNDPVVELYGYLVPKYICREKFEKKIIPFSGRVKDPDDATRKYLWDRVSNIFQ